VQSVIETPYYLRRATKLLSEVEQSHVIAVIADNPRAGDIMAGTGGLRKLRFSKEGKGKSGGVRVMYYFYDEKHPIYLFDIFGKNEKDNLSKAERNGLAKLIAELKHSFKENIK
jgi:hypothetical protein